jgi:hypothetical protein
MIHDYFTSLLRKVLTFPKVFRYHVCARESTTFSRPQKNVLSLSANTYWLTNIYQRHLLIFPTNDFLIFTPCFFGLLRTKNYAS